MAPHIAIIGGGAGGSFCAIELKRLMPHAQVTLFEKSQVLLSKVRISGGGRCNVTHAQFNPELLSHNYPRGSSFLLPLFHRFQPKDTQAWFEKEGISLVTEEDGRMFPSTHSSETIISCFLNLMEKLSIEVKKGVRITEIEPKLSHVFLKSEEGSLGPYQAVVIATGSTPQSLTMLEKLQIEMVAQVPSLFTFNCPSSPFMDLSGVSIDFARVTLPEIMKKKKNPLKEGPILITHWGFSGPAVLKLSSIYARELFENGYTTPISIDWAPLYSIEELTKRAIQFRKSQKKLIKNHPLLTEIPKSLFEKIFALSGGDIFQNWNTVSNKQIQSLVEKLKSTRILMGGKTTYKNEFVTAGGVHLHEISPKTMSSKKYPWLFFTGEVLDIDGITGGFNFQAAWTTAWTAAHGIASFLS